MYKLCGGTLLVLLLNSRKAEIKETSILEAMLKLLNPNLFINKSTLKEQTKKFKMCREHSSLANDFEDASKLMKITEDIHKEYNGFLNRTANFIKKYVDTDSDTRKDEFLVKAILEVIEQDESIPDNQELYILPNDKSVTKKQLGSIETVYLPSFILGVLYYVMMNIKDNKEGAETYDEWCPISASGRRRKYTANLGENSSKHIVLIDTPEEYGRSKLVDSVNERVKLFVKSMYSDGDYDITTKPIVAVDSIDESENGVYIQFTASVHDSKMLNDFIIDCNELIRCVNIYNNAANNANADLLYQTKKNFFHSWKTTSLRFDDSSIKKWIEDIVSRIEQSKRIDIYDTTLERINYVEEVPSRIPFIKKKIAVAKYVEQRKKRT